MDNIVRNFIILNETKSGIFQMESIHVHVNQREKKREKGLHVNNKDSNDLIGIYFVCFISFN